MEPVGGAPSDDPVDRLILQLRAYVSARQKPDWRPDRRPSGITVVFDTETTVDPSQRLRFGAYQVRDRGELIERGVFHVENLSADDLEVLRATFALEEPTEAGEHLRLRSRGEFVEHVLFGWGLEVGGQIVGFNLPFDISRIAIRHTYAKGSMKGGFSFTLADGRPNIRVKHLSRRAAFVDFAGKDGDDKNPDRGFFVDVKTLAAALTSGSHSLQSLTKLLGTTPKSPLDSYDGSLTPEMVRYGMNDVQATWECFAKLAERFEAHGLTKTGLHELYSEASLGKAFLQAMKIRPWRHMQSKFPPELIGQIMSTYYGGRAEVHIRREITPVIHCDFRSMYPTVCTLMGLWRFVIARGMRFADATDDVRRLIDACTLDSLRDPKAWRNLACIVQVQLDDDIFPVRAVYPGEQTATIGLNRLSAAEPMWFTLPDVLAAKVLGGKSPKIISAIRFTPSEPQLGMRHVTLEGATVRPRFDDFYKLLIDQRGRVQVAERTAPEADKPALRSAAQSLKILANSTSYGIFVELNVQHIDGSRTVTCYDFRGKGRKMTVRKIEDPGRYFHPLLGTLITGAARLMLALAERNALDQGLDWALCDTDSLAIANAAGLSEAEFKSRVEAICRWFEPLNPYEIKGSILQLEKVNFPPGQDQAMSKLRPVNCLAVSAKRYVLFDREDDGAPALRKASAHGLGHLLAPYPDPDRGERIGRIGVELWQEELWREIIRAFDDGRPDEVDFDRLANFGLPAASRYAATNQTLLKWFDAYNETVEPSQRVWPFNFLLSYQAKSRLEMAAVDPEALRTPAWAQRTPHPASRYSSDLIKDPPPVFDRKTGEPIPTTWLKSCGRSLVRHHLHSEAKFRCGSFDERGLLRRRRVSAWAVIPIGKEADNLEEREFLGESDDDAVEWSMADQDHAKLTGEIENSLRSFGLSDRTLLARAGVSHHTLTALRNGGRITAQSLLSLARASEDLRHEAENDQIEEHRWRLAGLKLAAEFGSVSKLADHLGFTRQYLGRALKGERPMSPQLIAAIGGLC